MRHRRLRRARGRRNRSCSKGLRRLEYRGLRQRRAWPPCTGGRAAPAQEGRAASPTWPRSLARRSRPRAASASATPAGPRTARPPTATPTRTSAATARVAVVHNGVIENYAALKRQLQAEGVDVPQRHRHRGHRPPDRPLPATATWSTPSQQALPLLEGTYGLAVVSPRDPGLIVGARLGSPLVVGVGDGEHFLASDPSALWPAHADRSSTSRTGSSCVLTPDELADPRPRRTRVDRAAVHAHRLGARRRRARAASTHYMLKEIYEQPETLAERHARPARPTPTPPPTSAA